jgi:hypothetical protein
MTHLVGTLTALNTNVTRPQWTKKTYAIPSASWPAGTIWAYIILSHEGHAAGSAQDFAWIDDCSFLKTTLTAFDTSTLMDYIEGSVKPFLHYKLAVAESPFNITLQGNLEYDPLGTLVHITEPAEIQQVSASMPATWVYAGDGALNPIAIPTSRLTDRADTSGIYQSIRVGFDTTLPAAASPAYLDDVVLIPVDNGYAALPADDHQHILLDSQSDNPGIMVSPDGAVNNQVYYSSLRKRFTLDPQNGSNFAILNVWQDSLYNQIGQFLANVNMVYTPHYLLPVK